MSGLQMTSKRVVFAHGWGSDHRVWAPYIESFRKTYKNCEVINPDLPGHAADTNDKWTDGTLNSAIDKYTKILENSDTQAAAAAQADPPDTIGFGWSLGALLLLSIELKRPGTFKALILIGATPCFVSTKRFPYGQNRALVKRMMIDLGKDPREALDRFYTLNFTDLELGEQRALEFLYRYGAAHARIDPESLLNALGALYTADIIDELSLLDLPVLIIHGSQDLVAPIAAGRFLAGNIRGARLKIFENAGHAPFITEPDSFSSFSNDFINEVFR